MDILQNMSDEDRQRYHMKRAVDEVYVNNPPDEEFRKKLQKYSQDTGQDPDEVLNRYMTWQVLSQYNLHINDDFWNAPAYQREKGGAGMHLEYNVDVQDQLESVQTCKDAGIFEDKRPDSFWKACEGRVVASIPLEVMTYVKHKYGLDQSQPDFMKEIRRLALERDDRVLRGCLVNNW